MYPKSEGMGLAATVREWCEGQGKRKIQDSARLSDGREDSTRAQAENYRGESWVEF